MNLQSWRTELNRCLIILGITGLFGLLIDQLLLVWLITLATFVVISLYQLRRLNLWLLDATAENKIDPQKALAYGEMYLMRFTESKNKNVKPVAF